MSSPNNIQETLITIDNNNTTIDNNNTTIWNQYLITYNYKTCFCDILKIFVPIIVFICILIIAYYIIISIH
jgi:hypothetical protein